VGHEPVAVVRAVPHLRGAEHRPAAEADRRVHRADPEALRRHRAGLGHGARVRHDQPGRPDRDPPDEPDARRLPDLQRRQALRAVHVRDVADPLDRPLRLAPPDRAREDRQRELLPRARPADGYQGHPRHPPGLRRRRRPVRGRALRLRRRRPGRLRGDAEADGHLRAEPLRPPRRGDQVRQGADGRPAARRLRLPPPGSLGAAPGHRCPAPPRPRRPPPPAPPRTPLRPPAPQYPHLPGRLSGRRARHLPRPRPQRTRWPPGYRLRYSVGHRPRPGT